MSARPIPPIAGARPMTCQAGTVLFRPTDECPGFVSVHEGTIKVSLTGPGGREIVLYRVKPGDVCLQTFACLADGRTYTAEGIAETDIVAEIIPLPVYERLMAEDSAFRAHISSAIAHRFADFEHLVESLALTGLEARLAEALLRLADPSGEIQMTHEALAAEIGSAREVVSRQLARFARSGLVDSSRGRVKILRRQGLEQKTHEA
ncbi:MAG: Crp/Fnr family transcriptional regulator [Hyphomonas sp.]|uniref:Crp/Fnr family transcriptional regulator n=1 Tax=Hyphomonas sp. TaxID=87 RepID=UPI0035277147